MPLRTLIRLGPSAVMELTDLRTPCVLTDRFRSGLKGHLLSSAATGPPFRCGVMGVVRTSGPVAAGDAAREKALDGSSAPVAWLVGRCSRIRKTGREPRR